MVSLKEEKQNTLYTGMNFAVYNCCALYYIYKNLKMKMGGIRYLLKITLIYNAEFIRDFGGK